MCGRYRIKDPELFREYVRQVYGIEVPSLAPRYNVAPSQMLPVISSDADGKPRASIMRWGLVPFWDRSAKPKIAPINARAEEAMGKAMFRQSIQKRRICVGADGFYEWQWLGEGDRKQPFDIALRDGRPFFFAGIYEPATESRPDTYLLFTTQPNEMMRPIHDRMPAIITGDRARAWIEPGEMSSEAFAEYTAPFAAAEMRALPISTLVNSPRNDGPEVLAGPAQAELL